MAKTISKSTPIRELIIKFQNMKGDKAALISELLVNTHEFIVQTSLHINLPYQKALITPEKIEALLNKTAKCLKNAVNEPAKDEETVAVLQYCKAAIEERIKVLYEKNNKIAELLEGHELREVLSRKNTG